MKPFKTSNLEIVRQCQTVFGRALPSVLLSIGYDKFIESLSTDNCYSFLSSLYCLVYIMFFRVCIYHVNWCINDLNITDHFGNASVQAINRAVTENQTLKKHDNTFTRNIKRNRSLP